MRYTRQEGLVDQKKLSASTAAVVGLGGLGNPAATYLALAGVNLILVDNDVVEESNLNRQFLFTRKDVGKKKVDVAKHRLQEMNPQIKITVSDGFSEKSLKGADIVLDCLDIWETREKLWDTALKTAPIVHGGADELFGQVAVFLNEKDTVPFRKKKGETCRILGATAGVVGSRMAMEALSVLQGENRKKFMSFNPALPELAYNCIIIRFSEIWLKSRITRRKMSRILSNNITKAIGREVWFENVRFVTDYSTDVLDKLVHVFGVKSFSPAIRVEPSRIEDTVKAASLKLLSPEKSFRITVHRSWKGGRSSMELQKELGSIAAEAGARVDLSNPDVNIEVEVHKDYAYVFARRIDGPGGMPQGVEGRVLSLFSGGFDSPVATWMVARRGPKVEGLFMNPLGPALESKVAGVFDGLRKWIPGAKLWTVDVSQEVDKIKSEITEGLRQTVYKRFMYRVSEKAAENLGCISLATGESLGQVSSQTLQSLLVIGDSVKIPVLRPLIGMDKEEILLVARRVGTHDASAGIPEYCSIEGHSNAGPKLHDVIMEEKKLDFDFDEIAGRLREARVVCTSLAPPEGLELEVVRLWEGAPKLKKGTSYLFVCKSGNRADEEALRARGGGFDVFAMRYKDARKKGFII